MLDLKVKQWVRGKFLQSLVIERPDRPRAGSFPNKKQARNVQSTLPHLELVLYRASAYIYFASYTFHRAILTEPLGPGTYSKTYIVVDVYINVYTITELAITVTKSHVF